MKDIINLCYYLYNKWSLGESRKVFGKELGSHVWGRWNDVVRFGCGDQICWFMNLDNECRQKLVDRANEIYNKQINKQKNHETSEVFEQDEQQRGNHLDWQGW